MYFSLLGMAATACCSTLKAAVKFQQH